MITTDTPSSYYKFYTHVLTLPQFLYQPKSIDTGTKLIYALKRCDYEISVSFKSRIYSS